MIGIALVVDFTIAIGVLPQLMLEVQYIADTKFDAHLFVNFFDEGNIHSMSWHFINSRENVVTHIHNAFAYDVIRYVDGNATIADILQGGIDDVWRLSLKWTGARLT